MQYIYRRRQGVPPAVWRLAQPPMMRWGAMSAPRRGSAGGQGWRCSAATQGQGLVPAPLLIEARCRGPQLS